MGTLSQTTPSSLSPASSPSPTFPKSLIIVFLVLLLSPSKVFNPMILFSLYFGLSWLINYRNLCYFTWVGLSFGRYLPGFGSWIGCLVALKSLPKIWGRVLGFVGSGYQLDLFQSQFLSVLIRSKQFLLPNITKISCTIPTKTSSILSPLSSSSPMSIQTIQNSTKILKAFLLNPGKYFTSFLGSSKAEILLIDFQYLARRKEEVMVERSSDGDCSRRQWIEDRDWIEDRRQEQEGRKCQEILWDIWKSYLGFQGQGGVGVEGGAIVELSLMKLKSSNLSRLSILLIISS